MKRTLATLLALGLLTGCSASRQEMREQDALDDIHERSNIFDDAPDRLTLEILEDACKSIDRLGVEGFVYENIGNGLRGHDVGVIGSNAVTTYCPEHTGEVIAFILTSLD